MCFETNGKTRKFTLERLWVKCKISEVNCVLCKISSFFTVECAVFYHFKRFFFNYCFCKILMLIFKLPGHLEKKSRITQNVKISWKGEISNHDTKLVKRIDPRILTKISIIGQGVSTKSTNSSTKSCQTPISHSKRLRRPSPKNVNLSDQNQGISFLNGNNLSGDPEVWLHSTTYELIIPMM